MTKKFAISLRKNVTVAEGANTANGNYDVVSFRAFRKFATREQARVFKKSYPNPVVIINTATQQVVR